MQNSRNFANEVSAASLDGLGGEPLTGSGFETEEAELGFAIVDPAEKE